MAVGAVGLAFAVGLITTIKLHGLWAAHTPGGGSFAGLAAAAGVTGYRELGRRRKKRRNFNESNEPIDRDDDRF